MRTTYWHRQGKIVAESRFEQSIWPHLDAAYNLARYLMRSAEDAEDAVQEAVLRAYSGWEGYRGGDSRAWFLTIVRNSAYTLLRRKHADRTTSFDETLHDECDTATPTPEASLMAAVDKETLRAAVEALPIEYRETLILREMEDLSYREIAQITGAPLGTVMSRLTRARQRLQTILRKSAEKESIHGL